VHYSGPPIASAKNTDAAVMTMSAHAFDEHKKFLWGICYRMTGSASDAEDIVQDTFVRALEKPPADQEAPLRPWLVKVALNLSRDQLRRLVTLLFLRCSANWTRTRTCGVFISFSLQANCQQ
jgi:RNA polymerase sigma-70 factor (ECF subfamily)